MDPVLKSYLYNQLIADNRDIAELAKNHAMLGGSFVNPEAVKQMMNDNTHESSDEDFEESLKMVRDANLKLEYDDKLKKGKRKRKSKLKST